MMGQREIRELLVQQDKASRRVAELTVRALDALQIVIPVLGRCGRRLDASDRLLHEERRQLGQQAREALKQATDILDGKAPADDDG